jgi:hypothetical protein
VNGCLARQSFRDLIFSTAFLSSFNMRKTFTTEELRIIKKILTPEQIKLIQNKVSKILAEVRRSQFKVIDGGRRSKR